MVSTEQGAPSGARSLRVLLLEQIHPGAREAFELAGFAVDSLPGALGPDELGGRLAGVQILGIRSKTRITAAVLERAKDLLVVGCFCIGTNQVDLDAARGRGVPVFNAPFSNTRSVAELVVAEVISLARQVDQRSREMHLGRWRKVSKGCFEVRGKTLGIVGFGRIGSQVGVLAEQLGMRVLFHDVAKKLPLGNARALESLDELLRLSDFVTLHVPETPQTRGLVGKAELARMREGAYLLNASRGTVVDLEALAEALRAGHLAGAAVDVFPQEPEGDSDGFATVLQGLANVILTPHVGGSTVEAQAAIGREVSTSLTQFATAGSTTGAVNFPHADLTAARGTHRVLNVHQNVPGVLRDINRIVSDLGANIHGQVLTTDPHVGYLIMDLDQDVSDAVQRGVAALPTSIRTRIVY